MFSYYGSKSKVAQLYPVPQHPKIIEPFAGSARYSLLHFKKDVTLVDADEKIIRVWRWLQKATEKHILSFPTFKVGDNLKSFGFSDDEYEFLRLLLQPGTVGGSKACEWGVRDFDRNKRKVAEQLHKIRHWQFVHGCYLSLQNETATYFIDPPYQVGGHKYKHGNKGFDYDLLQIWCETREGQKIVCENGSATWAPFTPLKEMQGIRKRTTEAIWLP